MSRALAFKLIRWGHQACFAGAALGVVLLLCYGEEPEVPFKTWGFTVASCLALVAICGLEDWMEDYIFGVSKDAIKTLSHGRLAIHLLNDPDTPVIVEVRETRGRYADYGTATWHCATSTAEVDVYELTREEVEWLNSHEDLCERWYDEHRVTA